MATPQLTTARPRLRYKEVIDVVDTAIRSGQYSAGDRLPGMKEMSRQLGLNFLTVRKAMAELQDKGLVEIRHGVGTFVTEQPLSRQVKTIRLGIAYRTYVLRIDKHHPVMGAFLAGTHRRCAPPEFIVQPLFYGEDRFVEDIGQTILNEGLAGVIIADGRMREEDHEFLRRHGIHAVICSGGARPHPWTMTVRTDKSDALRQSVDHLRSFGHKRIAFIAYKHTSTRGETVRHYAQLAFNHRLGDPRELTVFVGNTDLDTHWEDVEKFFSINPLPTAAIVSDEYLADVLLDGCERRGVKVPEQLSIVTLQDAKPEGHRIPLTSVSDTTELAEKAAAAADLLVSCISGHSIEDRNVIVPQKLTIKASSGPAISADVMKKDE